MRNAAMACGRLIGAVTAAMLAGAAGAQGPMVVVDHDNVVIDRPCRVRCPADAVIVDADGDGVIHIRAGAGLVEFEAGSVLRGARAGAAGDQLKGIGIRVEGARGVTVRGARVSGFKVGMLASECDGLSVEGGEFSDNYRQRLGSTPAGEDQGDWLWPHENDGHQWRTRYGAGLCIERSRNVTVRDVVVRRGQNGIILDRVNDSKIYDNDCSFLSGWGIAMWRSSGNMISRNAADFCVRGHVEGVYNRGQDSAGFLVFEQCHRNIFAENSATHGGDCFFGFAGKEAIGEVPAPGGGIAAKDAGCNDNVIVGNDFSYAPAHGIELTFSHGNRIVRNRLHENAICGVWGGYSNDTWICENSIVGNGGMAYGLECGGVNIEHGSGNHIIGNELINNRCGVHLWWDDDGKLLTLPGVKANDRGVRDNVISGNRIEINDQHPFTKDRANAPALVGVRVRDAGEGHAGGNRYAGNESSMQSPRSMEFELTPGVTLIKDGVETCEPLPAYTALGDRRPVGARAALQGRGQIVMGEWGPWDHASPMVRSVTASGGVHEYEVFGVARDAVKAGCDGGVAEVLDAAAGSMAGAVVRVKAKEGTSVARYQLTITGPGLEWKVKKTLVNATWEVAAFAWSKDPRTDLAGYNADRLKAPQITATLPSLDLAFRNGGPGDLPAFAAQRDRAPGVDHFGISAASTMMLPKGRWRIETLSDDGVRVRVVAGGKTTSVIDNWTWHGPERNEGEFVQQEDGPATIEVDYFEIDGFAILKLDIQPVE